MPARLIDLLTIVTLSLAAPETTGSLGTAGAPVAEVVPVARPHAVDETALRYYAALKQTARVEAETRRLQRLDPAWKPPADLWESRLGSADETALWELFAADKIDALRAAIKARQEKEPNWTLSTELENKLRRKELRNSIIAGVQSKRWGEVATAAGNWRLEIDTSDVDTLWFLAESFAQVRRGADCRKVLESILASSSDPRERIATIHKALALLPMRDAEDLIRTGKIDAAGISEFDDIAIDITRARIGAFLHDTPGNEISQPELTRFQDYASGVTDPDQVALLAWYALKRNDLRQALEHFKSAIAKGGDAVVAHGLAHTLRRLGRLRDAEEVAYAWREPSPANSILFIDVLAEQLTQGSATFEPERLARYAKVTLQTASGEGAQALAWYAYNSCQLDTAAEWFRRAMAWFPKQTTTFGYALVLRRLKRTQEFLEVVNRYDGLFPQTVALLFPDETLRANDPCDHGSAKANEISRADRANASLRFGISPVPTPAMVRSDRAPDKTGPKASEFPIAVSFENPYRSQPGTRLAAPTIRIAGWRPSGPAAPVVDARRVPGVGVMPYERYGVSMLPGWNGASQPALTEELRLRPARGTPWSEQAALEISQIGASTSSQSAASVSRDTDAAARFHR